MDMLEFILTRYNYWIVIILMMTGLYIVFSRGNLVKTVVGLNVFQTSVFIFYITLSKVTGGTAPILPYPNPDKYTGGHGEGHKDEHDKAHEGSHATNGEVNSHQLDTSHDQNDVSEPSAEGAQDFSLTPEEAAAVIAGQGGNTLEANATGTVSDATVAHESLHDLSEIAAANSLKEQMPESLPSEGSQSSVSIEQIDVASSDAAVDISQNAADSVYGAADVIYSNPLPHVLILTAIVVGVATTAVGLALAVRIREAYGTIEEDALEAMDNHAATGSIKGEGGEA